MTYETVFNIYNIGILIFWSLLLFFPKSKTTQKITNYPYKICIALGYIMGWFNSRIILGVIFIVILQPIAFLMRIFGYDPLRLNQKNRKSYREKREQNQIS